MNIIAPKGGRGEMGVLIFYDKMEDGNREQAGARHARPSKERGKSVHSVRTWRRNDADADRRPDSDDNDR